MTPEIPRRHTIDVDSLQRTLTVLQVAKYYGFELPPNSGEGGEQRMACPCRACQGNSDSRSVSINTSDPFKRWKCHREGYGCGAQGNLVTLAYCFKHGTMPPGGRPRGRDFFAIAEDLEAIADGKSRVEASTKIIDGSRSGTQEAVQVVLEKQPNVPLEKSDNEAARKLVSLDDELVRDFSDMSPEASAYVRRRPFLTEATCREHRTGYMPYSSRSTLRGKWVYCVSDAEGRPLAWVGRNLKYEKEHQAWLAAGRVGDEPAKYRFPSVKLFRRGLELYGQEFLRDEEFGESLERYGILVVEGFTDRLRLHQLGVMSLAIMSNRITDEQTERLAGYAREYGYNRVGIMYDADAPGDEGAKETLWRLHEADINAYLVWSRRKPGGRFADQQPENLTDKQWTEIAETIDDY